MAVTNINNAWKNDLYPLIDKVFDFEYRNRLGALRKIVSEVDSHSAEYRVEGMGGYGELPEYTGELHNMDQRRGFVTVIRPVQKAGAIDIDYKYAKIDKSGEARSAGRRAAPPGQPRTRRLFPKGYGRCLPHHPRRCQRGRQKRSPPHHRLPHRLQ